MPKLKIPQPPEGKIGWPWALPETASALAIAEHSAYPKVTIITPSYNQGIFLEQTIRSVLLQGYQNLEYIIIDGGSTDDSVDIIKKYEPWITYWVSERDRGQTHAINKAFAIAQGDIIAWINSDDYYEPGALKAVADLFMREPDTCFVYGKLNLIDEKNQKTGEFFTGEYEPALEIAGYNHIPQQSAFWRRQVLDTIGLLDEKMHFSFDVDYWMRICLRFAFKHIPVTLADFRLWDGAKSASLDRFRWETLYANEKINFKDIPRPKGQSLETRKRIAWAFMQLADRRSRLGFSWYCIRHLLCAFLWDPLAWASKPFLMVLLRMPVGMITAYRVRKSLPGCWR